MEKDEKKKIKKIKKFKGKKNKSKIVLFIISLIILGALVYLLSNLSYFDISSIIVEGASYYTQDEIIQASKITPRK